MSNVQPRSAVSARLPSSAMHRLIVALCILMTLTSACKVPSQITLPTEITGGDPKTLEAATAAGQEIADRGSSRDFAGVWLMMSKEVRNKISQADFVAVQNACGKGGVPFHVTGVRMEGEDTALVRWNTDLPVLNAFKFNETMLYEDGKWVEAPDPEYAQDYGLPVQQIIAKRTAAGHCNKSATASTATTSTSTTTPSKTATTTTQLPADGALAVPGTRYAFPASYSPYSPAREQPADLAFEYRFHWLSGLNWTSWDAGVAEGAGNETLQSSCTPDCASGPRSTNPVRIRATNPQFPAQDTHCPANVRYYTDVVVTYPATVPPHDPSWRSADGPAVEWTTDDGLAAAHYSNWKPYCGS